MTNNKLYKLILTAFLVICFTCLNPFSVYAHSETEQQSSPASQEEQLKQLQADLTEITSKMALASPNQNGLVQVFDVKEGHVIKSVDNSSKIQKQTKRILKDIYEFAPEIQPDMNAKYIIRIPVKNGTSITLNNQNIKIQELFIFYYVNKEPLLLVFDENKHPFLFHTKQSIEPLLKLIQVE